MNQHACKEITPGCYRCELNKDEMEAIHKENLEDAEEAWAEYQSSPPEQQHAVEFIAGFVAGRES